MRSSTPLQTPAYWICFAGTLALISCAFVLTAEPSITSTAATEQPRTVSISVAQIGR